jgi:hypothetical protein
VKAHKLNYVNIIVHYLLDSGSCPDFAIKTPSIIQSEFEYVWIM